MITQADIVERVTEWQLTEEVIEKDYVLGWLLWGLGNDPILGDKWVFKGGTCLKKCYIETHRFSEDLDFTVLPGGPFRPDEIELAPHSRARPRPRRLGHRLLVEDAGAASSPRRIIDRRPRLLHRSPGDPAGVTSEARYLRERGSDPSARPA